MRKKTYRSFTDARKFVHKLELKNRDEWSVFCKSGKKPEDMPADPAGVYKNKGWKSWGDWLGTGMIAYQDREYKSFEDARKFVRSLKLKNWNEWYQYAKSDEKPDDVPSEPRLTYRNKGWKSYGDWLGTGTLSPTEKSKNWLSAKEARIEIKKIAKEVFGGKPFTPKDWVDAHKAGKIPANLPRYLHDIYNPDYRKRKKK